MSEQEPDFTKAVNVKAFFFNKLGACGCSELDVMLYTIHYLIEWMNDRDRECYDTLFGGDTGVYYIIAGILDSVGLCEHGGSIRYPWLTPKGKNLLRALQTFSIDQIEQSVGEAYDGCEYQE